MIVGYPKQVSPQENSNQLREQYKVPKPQRLVEPDKVTIAFYLRAKSIDLFTDSAAVILNSIEFHIILAPGLNTYFKNGV